MLFELHSTNYIGTLLFTSGFSSHKNFVDALIIIYTKHLVSGGIVRIEVKLKELNVQKIIVFSRHIISPSGARKIAGEHTLTFCVGKGLNVIVNFKMEIYISVSCSLNLWFLRLTTS